MDKGLKVTLDFYRLTRSQTKKKRTCLKCGKVFMSKDSGSRFCSEHSPSLDCARRAEFVIIAL
jgi:ribosomal protein S27AE